MIILNPTVDLTGLSGAGQGKAVISPDDGTLVVSSPAWEANVRGYHLLSGWMDFFNGATGEFATGSLGSGATAALGPSDEEFPASYLMGTGTSSTGRISRSNQLNAAVVFFDATSGTFRYEAKFRYNSAVSDGTDTYVFRSGILDSNTAVPTDGVYLEIDSNTDAQAQFVARNNNTETRVDSGVTVVQGTVYRLIIVVTNDTLADFYFAPEATAPTITGSITTNLPSNQATSIGTTINKSAGTNDRRVELMYMLYDHDRVA